MDSDDSQVDFFATQKHEKRKEFITSSAPPLSEPTNFVYPWFAVFKWGGDIDHPFEILSVEDVEEGELDSKLLTGLLAPPSRLRHRELKCFPDFSISVFAKIESSKNFVYNNLIANYVIFYFLIDNSETRRNSFILQLNERFKFIFEEKKKLPNFNIDGVLEQMISERPYRILSSTKFLYLKVFYLYSFIPSYL